MKTLRAWYSKKEKDIMIDWSHDKSDAWLLHNHVFSKGRGEEFIKELIERGYDITTLKFSIKGKDKND